MSDNDTIKPARPTITEQREDEEHLRQVETSEGMEFVAQTESDKAQKHQSEIDKVNTYLEEEKDRRFTYRRDLCTYGNDLLPKILDTGWEGRFIPTDGTPINIYDRRFKTDEGVVLVIKYKSEVFIKAIRTSMMSDVDTNAIRVMCEQAENTIDSRKGLLLSDKKSKKTDSGIYLE